MKLRKKYENFKLEGKSCWEIMDEIHKYFGKEWWENLEEFDKVLEEFGEEMGLMKDDVILLVWERVIKGENKVEVKGEEESKLWFNDKFVEWDDIETVNKIKEMFEGDVILEIGVG